MLTLALASFLSSTALADTWTVDSAHSTADFGVSHLTIATVKGTMGTLSGTVDFDGNPANLKITGKVDVGGIDTGIDKRDNHLRSADFFDAENHPEITFTSTKVKKVKGNTFTIVGDLTMRGVTKQVELEAKGLDKTVNDPWGNTKSALSAEFSLNRHDYGLSWNQALDSGGYVVGDTVDIELHIELTKQQPDES